MKQHTNDFKNELINMGKEIDSIITYDSNGTTVTLHEELYSISLHYDGGLLKSIMKQLDVESSVEIPLETVINYKLGVKVGNSYEYLDYGNYIVYSIEKNEDTDTYKIICYDNMLKAMKKYEPLEIIYPITIERYLYALCNKIGVQFGSSIAVAKFYNMDKIIDSDLYEGLDYTYRDILDEIAQATGSIIRIASNNKLVVVYPKNVGDIQVTRGENIVIAQHDDSKLMNFKVYGSSTQNGTPSSSNPVPIINTTGDIEIEITDEDEENSQQIIFPLGNEKLFYGSELNNYGIEHYRTQVIFDGSEDEQWSRNVMYNNVQCFSINLPKKCGYGGNALCTHFKNIYDNSDQEHFKIELIYNGSDKLYIYIDKNTALYVNDFKTWLQNNPITLEYLMGQITSDIVKYTEEQQEVWNNIRNLYLYDGDNYINSNAEVEVEYVKNFEVIDENYLKDVNVKFGEKYGPINSIVLSRSAESDNVYIRNEDSIEKNGLCEIKIKDNQILNWNNRSDYLQGIYNALDGLSFYVNDFSSIGILYLESGEIYNIKIGDTNYRSIMLNDEINITSGIEELIYTEKLEESETDYTKADKTDKKLNQAYIIVDKQNREIDAVISEIGNRDGKTMSVTEEINQVKMTVDGITNQLIVKGGNNLFYYGKEFWQGETVTETVRRNIQVGDDLSGKKIYITCPTTNPVDILDYNTNIVIQSEGGNIYHYKREAYAEEYVSVIYGNNEDIVYEMEAFSYVDGVAEYTMPNNFGVVTQINDQSGVYQYLEIDVQETKEIINLEEISGGEFTDNTVSGRGYIVNNGSARQDTSNTDVSVPNNTYTVSFLYKKIGPALANGSVKINGNEYALTEDEWTKFEQIVEVSSNHIEVEFIADTDNTLYVADLLGNVGTVAEIWTQNPNETITDTVKIGKGIEVISSLQDTKLKADADGVRIVEVNNEKNIVAEFTKEGTRIKKLIAENQAQITGILIQQVGDQTWISSLL